MSVDQFPQSPHGAPQLPLPQGDGRERLRDLYARLSGPQQCVRETFFRRDRYGRIDYVTVCWTHDVVGSEHQTFRDAFHEICIGAEEAKIARRRALALLRFDFQPVSVPPEEVVSHVE